MRHVFALHFAALALLTNCQTGPDPIDAAMNDVRSVDASDASGIDTDPIETDPGSTARDFTLRARGMDAFIGHAVGAWVVDSTGGIEMGFVRSESVSANEFELRLPSLLPEGDYRTDVFVDTNGNGQYDGPMEPSWSVTIPSQGSATAMLAGSDATTDLGSVTRMPRTDFTASLSGFSADEIGHDFELRVIDESSNATLGGDLQPHIPANGTLQLVLPGIVDTGSAYRADFWVDMDGDGAYGGPSVDHTWRVEVLGTSLTWTRTDTYTELDWR